MNKHPYINGLIIIVVFVVVVAMAGYVYISTGMYNIAATDHHNALTRRLIGITTDASIERRAEGIAVPTQASLEDSLKGFPHYNEMCVDCHGAPGIDRSDIGKGIYPRGPLLAKHDSDLSPAEMFWIIKNGIKLTGMPAFGLTHTDEQIWEIVAFTRYMPHISSEDYAKLQDTMKMNMEEEMEMGEHQHSHE
jgi:mono/diheme cytochrome c family protein